MKKWRLLLTRSVPDCYEQAEKLLQYEVNTICLPLLAIKEAPITPLLKDQLLNFDQYTTIIVISKHAARLLLNQLDQYWPQLPIQQAWFTVGQASAKVLEQANLSVSFPKEQDTSEALWALPAFQQALTYPHSKVLIVKGHGGREWLFNQLTHYPVPTQTLELYTREKPSYLPHLLYDKITHNRINGIVISSEQALNNLHSLSAQYWVKLANIPLFVPSLRVADKAQMLGSKYVINCNGAGLDALTSALKINDTP